MTRSRATMVAVLITLLMRPTVVAAHRLDEYLQATRVGIETNRVNLEIDLTPGVSIATQVTGWIDTNGDGQLSEAEGLAYAKEVLTSLEVTADRTPVALPMGDVQLPEVGDIARGIGTIRLRVSAELPEGRTGNHELRVVNTHHPQLSIYLSNALIPSDRRIQILTQRRDRDQHSLTIGYNIETTATLRRISWLTGALGLLGMAMMIRGGLGRLHPRRAHPV